MPPKSYVGAFFDAPKRLKKVIEKIPTAQNVCTFFAGLGSAQNQKYLLYSR